MELAMRKVWRVLISVALAATIIPAQPLAAVPAGDVATVPSATDAQGATGLDPKPTSRTDSPQSAGKERGDASDRTDAADRIREGTRWQNERGIFTLVGDRVTFTPNSQRNQNFMVLENLNLERIVRTIEENRTVTDADTLEWNIDGTVTEFRGGNFVLVTRSVLVARPRSTEAGR